MEKPVVWVGTAQQDLQKFPEQNKTRRTRKQDIDLARSRRATVLANREGSHG